MATRNEFKIIQKKARKMFDNLKIDGSQIDEINKERIGFYHLVLENITGGIEKDSFEIIDTKYNKQVYNIDIDDLGMDAVSIVENEDQEIDIKIFNFKYREAFKKDKGKSEGDISRSTKFLEFILRDKKLDENKNSKVNKIINRIIENLDSNKICNIYMYMISNEAKGFSINSNEYIKTLEDNYEMKIINIGLDEIISYFKEKNEDRCSKFIISQDEILAFQIDEITTEKSYVLKLSLLDLIRITCNDEEYSNKYDLESDEELIGKKLDYSLLYDNVRGYLGETKFNKNILNTLENEHKKFFLFNNGITITSENIDCKSANSGKKYIFTIKDFQIVNGGQTLRSIYNFFSNISSSNSLKKVREAYVLIRIFKIGADESLQNQIAEYSNSQNAISDSDLKSVDKIQIELEYYLRECNILYIRKAGNVGAEEQNYSYRITMEKLAQLIYSTQGYPDRASNQKRRLFSDYYDSIFKSKNFSMENCYDLIMLYYKINDKYKSTSYSVSDQKIFYIFYLTHFTNKNIKTAINSLEESLTKYKADEELSGARKLIQRGFKDFVNESLNIDVDKIV